ncbi:APC membrane recruitment protein 1 [Trichomycterus rosablanca]|uniref:APC membrane recruitment protein 1 n=1 Tax=Trichomycterus rosablanca TaxID=2290929 RepID=UPI002F35B6A8
MESVTGSELPGAAGGPPSEPISHDPQQPQTCPTGKLRKTAFRFFAGRKSICMLPSFFVGRAKGQARGSSKTGVTKSQTYDGVSRAGWDDSVRGSGDVTSADFEFHNPNSLVDPRKLQESFERSQSLPRQKRGLRGFFSSIRRHRKNKNVEPEKNETFEMSSGEIVRVASPNLDRLGDYSCDQSEASQPNVPLEACSGDLPTPSGSAPENSTKHDMLVPEEDEEEESEQMKTEDDTEEERRRKSVLVTYQQPLSAESEMLRLVELRADLPEADLPALSTSSDNLVFGDVSSLKSFDSLTGCGDIIADQDDVSIAESSVSGERASRSAGKRSSCLVTYQGGGEEMATPDEVDNEYLDSLWESEGSEVCYLPSEQPLSPSTTPDQPTSSFQVTTSSGNTGTSPLGMTEAALTPTDLLTPQSDRQGSVPNSDEGYYDSTTPGADEETRDCPPKERLPRDSYSGDALYELFEADDELLSPQVASKDSQGFLGHNQNKADILYALSSAALETGAMETEEERLSRIQHALLCCELQNLRNASEDQHPYHGDRFYGDENSADKPHQQQGGRPAQGSHHALQEHGGGRLQHRTLYGSDSVNSADSSSSPQVSETPSPLQDAVMYSEQEQCKGSDPSLPPTRGGSQSQEDLMVCFSQALVDFTQNSRRYRNSTESLDCSESSSPFGPSLSALPAIVTFDVVDMENEGECEQPEPAEEEEDLASPYEDFEDDWCYLQQDAFAECDQRTFDAYEQSLLFSNAWGIASLPRHLSLSRPGPPVPAPLSLNRRSRSLDTDSLEHQTSELYASVLAHGNKVISFQHRKNNPETGFCDMALPRQAVRDSRDDWRPGRACDFDSSKKDTSLSQQQQRSLQGSPWLEVSACPSGRQPTVRPSYLPLQATYHNSSAARGTKTSAEGNVSAGRSDLYPCSYPPGVKNRPVGITQGIPHLRPDRSDAAREITAKNRRTDIEREYPQ